MRTELAAARHTHTNTRTPQKNKKQILISEQTLERVHLISRLSFETLQGVVRVYIYK